MKKYGALKRADSGIWYIETEYVDITVGDYSSYISALNASSELGWNLVAFWVGEHYTTYIMTMEV